jgi:hypothetical protein
MVVSLSAPSRGLPAKDAKEIATFLKFAVGAGQVRGTAVGQLPPGYLAMTSGNGLAALTAYAVRASGAVSSQNGTVPSLTAPASTGSGGNGGTSGASGGGGTSTAGHTGTTGSPSVVPSAPSTPKPSPSGTVIVAEPVGRTQALGLGAGGLLLPLLLGIAGVAALVGGAQVLLSLRGRRS